MTRRNQRGVVHILLLAILVLVLLSVLARCDIDSAEAYQINPHPEVPDALEPNPCRCGNNLAGPASLQHRL